MAGEQLNIPQRTACFVNQPGCPGNERAAA